MPFMRLITLGKWTFTLCSSLLMTAVKGLGGALVRINRDHIC